MGWRTVLERNEGEELYGRLRIVGLEKDEGSDKKSCEDRGEQTRLLNVRCGSVLCRSMLTNTSRVSMSSAKSAIISSS